MTLEFEVKIPIEDESLDKKAEVLEEVEEQKKNVPKIDPEEFKFCRFCHDDSDSKSNKLITPCLCKGSLEFVHRLCLERWLNESNRQQCDICQFQFSVEEKLRYNCLESGIVWIRKPENRAIICMDSCFCFLLSIICFILLLCGSLGLSLVINSSNDTPQTTLYIRIATSLFLLILGMIYLVNMCLLVKGQICPWFRWWRTCKVVQIIDRNSQVENV